MPPSRTYGGRTPDERRDERRARLIGAAIGIWGDEGWAAVTMRRVCGEAKLIDRYFYESFADRDALLVAAWDQLRDETVQMVVAAIWAAKDAHPIVQLGAAIGAIVHGVEDDPRRARIQFGVHAGSAALEARRREALLRFTTLLVDLARPFLEVGTDEKAFRMSVLLGIGGFAALVTAWIDGVVDADASQVIHQAASDGAALATRYLQAKYLPVA